MLAVQLTAYHIGHDWPDESIKLDRTYLYIDFDQMTDAVKIPIQPPNEWKLLHKKTMAKYKEK